MRIVGQLPWAVHALYKTRLCQSVSERIAGILDPSVGVKDHAGTRASMEYRSIERCERQSHIFVSAHTPTDDPTRILVDDNRPITATALLP
jgi:hypothetical protein